VADVASACSGTSKALPPLAALRAALSYNPDTGEFVWLRRGNPYQDVLAGKPAFITNVNGYLNATIDGERYQAPRVAFKMVHGRDPLGEVDHINGDRSDNRVCNLREVTASENRRNAACPRTNTSGIVGVSYRADKRRWRANITLNNRAVHLGYFDTWGDAVNARAAAEREHGFHPNHGRRA
jgi:hypothetical protein